MVFSAIRAIWVCVSVAVWAVWAVWALATCFALRTISSVASLAAVAGFGSVAAISAFGPFAAFAFAGTPFQRAQTHLRTFHKFNFHRACRRFNYGNAAERRSQFALFIQDQNGANIVRGQRKQFYVFGLRYAVVHQHAEEIGLLEHRFPVCGFEPFGAFWKRLHAFHVGFQLVIQAAFQATTLAAELALVNGQVLVAGGGGADGFKLGQPG